MTRIASASAFAVCGSSVCAPRGGATVSAAASDRAARVMVRSFIIVSFPITLLHLWDNSFYSGTSKTYRHAKTIIRISESRWQGAAGGAAAEFNVVAPGAAA